MKFCLNIKLIIFNIHSNRKSTFQKVHTHFRHTFIKTNNIHIYIFVKSQYSSFRRFGRKPLLMISGVMMTACLGILGYYFKLKDGGSDVSAFGWLPLTSLALFNVVFSIGYGSVPFAVISEIFPPETKGVASSMSIVVHWSLVFIVTKLFPIMEDKMGQAATFWTFSFFTSTSVAFAYFVLPETKGKTLQEIQRKLARRHTMRTEYPSEPVG